MQRNKMFKNFTKRVTGIILICAMCITSLWLTDVNFADDSVEADDFDIPAEEGTYFFDGLSYKKIDETNPFTKEMYDLAVSSLDDNGDYEVDEVIHNPDQCSIYNKDELDALFYVYNHDNIKANGATNLSGKAENSRNNSSQNSNEYLRLWDDDDWKFARLVIQALHADNQIEESSSPYFASYTPCCDVLNSRSLLGNYYYVVRLIIPYDNCGNVMINSVGVSVHPCSRDNIEYLDDAFTEEDNFFKSGKAEMKPGGHPYKYKIVDKTPHIAVDDNMVVVSRIQQKDNKNHDMAYYYKNDKTAYAGYVPLFKGTDNENWDEYIFERFPSNMLFLLNEYIDVRRYYSYRRDRGQRYPNPTFTIKHKAKKMSIGTATVYNAQAYFDKCDEFAKANKEAQSCFDWTPVTSSELICEDTGAFYNAIDLYDDSGSLTELSKTHKSYFNNNKKLIKRFEELEFLNAPQTLEDNELSDFLENEVNNVRKQLND